MEENNTDGFERCTNGKNTTEIKGSTSSSSSSSFYHVTQKVITIVFFSKVKVVKMLVVVVIIFVVSWMPLYIIFARIKLGGDVNHWEENILAYITPVAQWMGSSNSCINPIL